MKEKIFILSALIIVIVLGSIPIYGQNISVTFTGTGAATQVDSAKATNLTTNQSVTLPGNETLLLTTNTGIPVVSELANSGIVYPNPFQGTAIVSISVMKSQTVYLKIQNMFGQVVSQTKTWVQSGNHEFNISTSTPGMYIVSLTTDQGTVSNKVICEYATGSINTVQYRGGGSYPLYKSGLNTSQSGYTLGYTSGDIILYKCFSGSYTTVVTDSPIVTKNYEVEFVSCVDPGGRNYAVVKIGDQHWMAENAAYLPFVSSSSNASEVTPHYYVYDYQGSNASIAKATSNFGTYGVLYNWEAAKTACPLGWHLPTDDEWKVLEKNQGMSESDANSLNWRNNGAVGTKLKESGANHWISPNTRASNSSGFTALPSGSRTDLFGFSLLGGTTYFWSSSEVGSTVYYRVMNYESVGVVRYPYNIRNWGISVRCLKNN